MTWWRERTDRKPSGAVGSRGTTSPGRERLRFYGLGTLVICSLLFASAMRVVNTLPEDRIWAGGYFGVAFVSGVLYMWNVLREKASKWTQDPGSPGNRAYWRLVIACVIAPLLDQVLAGGLLLVATGGLVGATGWLLLTTALAARRGDYGNDHSRSNESVL